MPQAREIINTSVEAEGFLAGTQAVFEPDPLLDAPRAVKAVVDVMPAHVAAGEMKDMKASFPRDLRPMPLLLPGPRRLGLKSTTQTDGHS